jgi:hypothetical protein
MRWESNVREEFVDPQKRSQDESDDGEMLDEVGLRPRSLSDFVGQRELKEHLSIVLEVRQQTICCSLVLPDLAKPHLPELLRPKCLRTCMSPRAQPWSVLATWQQY